MADGTFREHLYQPVPSSWTRRTLPCVDSMTHPLLRHRRAGCECAARTVEALGDREVERIATRPSHRAVNHEVDHPPVDPVKLSDSACEGRVPHTLDGMIAAADDRFFGSGGARVSRAEG